MLLVAFDQTLSLLREVQFDNAYAFKYSQRRDTPAAAMTGQLPEEVKEDRLMLTRSNDYIMVGGKFPRLTKKTAAGRLKEIKKLLLAL